MDYVSRKIQNSINPTSLNCVVTFFLDEAVKGIVGV